MAVIQGKKVPGGLVAIRYTTEEMVLAIIGIIIPALEK
jgi:hypothetical protein